MTARALAAPSGQSFEPAATPGRGRLTTLLALLLIAALHGAAWFAWNRPAAPPDWRGQVNGFAFAPYQRGQSAEDGDWPTAEQIAADLRVVAPLTRRIRTYTVDGGFDRIPAIARQQGLDLRVTLGAWLDGRVERDAAELKRLAAAARARNVDMLMVGNEAVLRGDLTPAKLAADIRQVRAMGVRQPISTAEPWHVWLAHPKLAQAVDVITIHLLPYWEGLPVQDALRFTMEKYQAVAARFPGKRIVIGEVGWPSDGRDIGVARASRVNQAAFLRGFFAEAEKRHLDYFVMEAFDQPWKVSFEGRAAGHWGMFDLDRQAKWPLAGQVQETPAWPLWAAGATLFSFLATLLLLNRRPDIRLPGKLLLGALAQVFTTGIAAVVLTMAGSYLTWSASGGLGRAAARADAAAGDAAGGWVRAGGDRVGPGLEAPPGGTGRCAAAQGLDPRADLQRAAAYGDRRRWMRWPPRLPGFRSAGDRQQHPGPRGVASRWRSIAPGSARASASSISAAGRASRRAR